MRACEGVYEGVGSFILELLLNLVQLTLSSIFVHFQLLADFVFDLFVFEIGLPIEIFSLYEAVQFIFRGLQKNNIGWKLLILFYPYNISNMHISPFILHESVLPKDLSFGVVNLLVGLFSF